MKDDQLRDQVNAIIRDEIQEGIKYTCIQLQIDMLC